MFNVQSNCTNSVHTISQSTKAVERNKSTVPYLKHDLSWYHLVCSGPLKTCGPSDVAVRELYHRAMHSAYFTINCDYYTTRLLELCENKTWFVSVTWCINQTGWNVLSYISEINKTRYDRSTKHAGQRCPVSFARDYMSYSLCAANNTHGLMLLQNTHLRSDGTSTELVRKRASSTIVM